MIHSPRFKVILDACVLYPAPLRDYLLSLASLGMYKPFWTNQIQEEWIRNLLAKRPDLKRKNLEKTSSVMNIAFPDSNIENYETLIPSIQLPDPDDRHVLAAGVKVNADIIITFNIKDFPENVTTNFDIEVQHPDEFVSNLIDLDIQKALQAFLNQLSRLKNPPLEAYTVFEYLEKNGLPQSVNLLKRKYNQNSEFK